METGYKSNLLPTYTAKVIQTKKAEYKKTNNNSLFPSRVGAEYGVQYTNTENGKYFDSNTSDISSDMKLTALANAKTVAIKNSYFGLTEIAAGALTTAYGGTQHADINPEKVPNYSHHNWVNDGIATLGLAGILDGSRRVINSYIIVIPTLDAEISKLQNLSSTITSDADILKDF